MSRRFVWNTMLKAYANAGDEAWQEWNQELYRRHLRPIDWDLFRVQTRAECGYCASLVKMSQL